MGVFNFRAAPGAERPSIFHWHEPGTSKEEKWLIRKLDIFILTYSCLCFFIKYLDQTNISNAYVSGMKEELGLCEHSRTHRKKKERNENKTNLPSN